MAEFCHCVDRIERGESRLFRPIPACQPSGESYATAVHAMQLTIDELHAWREFGLIRRDVDPRDAFEDLGNLVTGVVARHLSNEPGVPYGECRTSRTFPALVARPYSTPISPEEGTMETTITRAADLPITTAADGARLAREQRLAFADEASRLTPEQWGAPTESPRWTVFEMAAHVASQNQAHPLTKTVPSIVRGKLRYRSDNALDAMNEIGIDARRHLTPEHLVRDLRQLAAVSPTPAWLRHVPLGSVMGLPAYTTGAYLGHVIYVRDVWTHRVEIARAIGREVPSDAGSAEVVAQVIRDLGKQWKGPDVVLTLTGRGRLVAARHRSDDGVDAGRRIAGGRLRTAPLGAPTDLSMFDHVPDAVRQSLADARVAF